MILVLFFVAIFGLVLSAGLLLYYRTAVLGRLHAILEPRIGEDPRIPGTAREAKPSVVTKLVELAQDVLPRNPQEVSLFQGRLIRAGFRDRSAINIFYASRVLVPILLAVLATVTGLYKISPIFIYIGSAGVGFMLPEFWLGHRISSRHQKIAIGLPEALDLMVICTEAGLGLDQAMARVAKEIRLSQPEISEELILVGLEQKAGKARAEALRSFSDRVDIDSVKMLTTTLIQSDTFGTSVSKSLRVYSDTMRTRKGQNAQEMAAKTTVKLVFPLVLFIFPSLFLVILGPVGIKIMESFKTIFG
jgi:tight adherence protein C